MSEAQSTRGHALLRDWLRSKSPRGNRNDDRRPDFPTIRVFMDELNAASPIDEGRQIKSPYALYDWIEGSQNPTKPGRWWRDLIEQLSGGAVPAASWDEVEGGSDNNDVQAAG